MDVSNPSEFPDPTTVTIEEPYVKAQIMVPQELLSSTELAQRKRGDFVTMDYIDDNRSQCHLSNSLLRLSLTSLISFKSSITWLSKL